MDVPYFTAKHLFVLEVYRDLRVKPQKIFREAIFTPRTPGESLVRAAPIIGIFVRVYKNSSKSRGLPETVYAGNSSCRKSAGQRTVSRLLEIGVLPQYNHRK
jgi:hypothetical protein